MEVDEDKQLITYKRKGGKETRQIRVFGHILVRIEIVQSRARLPSLKLSLISHKFDKPTTTADEKLFSVPNQKEIKKLYVDSYYMLDEQKKAQEKEENDHLLSEFQNTTTKKKSMRDVLKKVQESDEKFSSQSASFVTPVQARLICP